MPKALFIGLFVFSMQCGDIASPWPTALLLNFFDVINRPPSLQVAGIIFPGWIEYGGFLAYGAQKGEDLVSRDVLNFLRDGEATDQKPRVVRDWQAGRSSTKDALQKIEILARKTPAPDFYIQKIAQYSVDSERRAIATCIDPAIVGLMNSLQEAGTQIHVLFQAPKDCVAEVQKRAATNLSKFSLINTEELGHTMPEDECYRALEQRCGSNLLYVGGSDMEGAISGAQKAGWKTVHHTGDATATKSAIEAIIKKQSYN